MNILICFVVRVQRERLGAEPAEALLVNESLERVDTGDKNINSHIELVAVQQKRILKITLNNHGLPVHDLLHLIDQLNTSAS